MHVEPVPMGLRGGDGWEEEASPAQHRSSLRVAQIPPEPSASSFPHPTPSPAGSCRAALDGCQRDSSQSSAAAPHARIRSRILGPPKDGLQSRRRGVRDGDAVLSPAFPLPRQADPKHGASGLAINSCMPTLSPPGSPRRPTWPGSCAKGLVGLRCFTFLASSASASNLKQRATDPGKSEGGGGGGGSVTV